MSWRMSGLRAWFLQRISALYLVGFFVYFIGSLVVCPPASYIDWRDWMTSTSMSMATAVFFLMLFTHAWVGVRDVLIDYVRPYPLRVTLLTLLGFGLLMMSLWMLRILLMGVA